MSEYDDAVTDYNQFEKDVDKARDQYEEINEMYNLYKEIGTLESEIEMLEIERRDCSEGRDIKLSTINVLKFTLEELDNEYNAKYSNIMDIHWPIMGENYINYMNNSGISIRGLDSIYKIIIEDIEMPQKPEMI